MSRRGQAALEPELVAVRALPTPVVVAAAVPEQLLLVAAVVVAAAAVVTTMAAVVPMTMARAEGARTPSQRSVL